MTIPEAEIFQQGCHLPWYVVRVRANAERQVARGLAGRGVEVFLPIQSRMSRGKRAAGRIEIPLFPGYLFAQFDTRSALPVLMCPGVVHILSRGSTPEPVDPDELYALQSVTRLAQSVEALPTFTVGQKVRITGGPLADVQGVVLRDNGRERLVVSISLLHRSVIAEVEREWLENIEPSVGFSRWAEAGV